MFKMRMILVMFFFTAFMIVPVPGFTSTYLIGSGIYDITGTAGEIVMEAFAVSSQKTAGIHTRLRSRAFVVGDGTNRVVFVSADLGMMFQMVKKKCVRKLLMIRCCHPSIMKKMSSFPRLIPIMIRVVTRDIFSTIPTYRALSGRISMPLSTASTCP